MNESMLTREIFETLHGFSGEDLNDKLVTLGIMAAVYVKLSDIQDDYPDFDADGEFIHDPEPLLVIRWIHKDPDFREIHFRFKPLRVAHKQDIYEAYDRAMSIL